MSQTAAYAASHPGAALRPWTIQRRNPGPHDVVIDISWCGVCHSDIHQVGGEWGSATFPMVPGHEIVGTVAVIGSEVTRHGAGDVVGVGVFVDSCRTCEACVAGEEQYCLGGMTPTYNGTGRDGSTTYGGYSDRIVVDEAYVLRIPEGMDLAAAAPLLCAGITTYSPIRHFGVQAGQSTAVAGLGGLGHMGVKWLRALGAEVTVLSHSPAKRDDALRLGADDFVVTSEKGSTAANAGRFHFILDTVSAEHGYDRELHMLRRDGTLALVGLPPPGTVNAGNLIAARRRLAGSSIGGIRETQEMLDFAASHGIAADVEVISMAAINEAFERTRRSEVRYRFVIDIDTLRSG
ncbi:MAG: NAD(P)-dependent alcohol dehydrogenase [Candidatus Dormibacteria bacterium]